jgi:hypothetical protein
MNRWVGAIAAISLLALTAACNSDDTATGQTGDTVATPTPKPKPTPVGTATVTIKNNKVSPSTVLVETGGTVIVRNNDSVGHRLDNRANHLYSGTIRPKGKDEITMPPDPGTYVFTDPNNSAVKLKVKVS